MELLTQDATAHYNRYIAADSEIHKQLFQILNLDFWSVRRRPLTGKFNSIFLAKPQREGSSISISVTVRRRTSKDAVTRNSSNLSAAGSIITESTQVGDLNGGKVGVISIDQMDLLVEQVKMLAGEIAFSSSTMKRLVEQSANDPESSKTQEIEEKRKANEGHGETDYCK
ncbi:hypothetical protein LXL04_021561 [Taraxacum kok-saghyz]